MNTFYPKGALRGRKFKALLNQRYKKPSVIYLVSGRHPETGLSAFRLLLKADTKVEPIMNRWHAMNMDGSGTLTLRVNPQSGYVESTFSEGYIFDNFWHAYAYILHLKQSGLRVDWEFPVAID